MKKLTKALLINWLYYDKLVLSFSDINYIVGKNASGKSTFLDAIMIVLLGEVSSRNFNKAANESSQRTLKKYLRADMDPNNPKTRKGRSFSTYIACEFLDDVSMKSFTAGIVFDCHEEGGERYNFFIYDDVIPDNYFINDRKPMDVSELRRYLKDVYKSRQEIYDSNKKYRAAIKAKWNIHVDQVFSVLKRGVFFKPIESIRDFITEYICDVQEKPDIVSMQQNIHDYKHQEKLAERLEERLSHLKEIHELARLYMRAEELLNIHEFLKARAEAEIELATVTRLEEDLKNAKLELISLEAEAERLGVEAEEHKSRHIRLIADRENSEPYKEQVRLETEKKNLSDEKDVLSLKMDKTAVAVRTEVFKWLRYGEETETAAWAEDNIASRLICDIPDLKSALGCLERLKPDDFGQIDISVYIEANVALKRHSDILMETCYELERNLAQCRDELDICMASLRDMEKGNKDYPEQYKSFKSALEKALAAEEKSYIQLYPLADLIEIKEPRWQKAVEGYLNTQRFLIITEPEHFLDALRAYDKIKREFPGYGLVDVEKVRRRSNIQRLPNSLATKVIPTNELAREYIDFLLGRVICCNNVDELRQHSTAITADGMLYQGYVARAIPRHILDSVYIGKSALEKQIQAKQEQIKALSAQKSTFGSVYSFLEKQKNVEIMLTGYYIEETMTQMPGCHARSNEISVLLTKIHEKMEELDTGWLLSIDEQIKEADKLVRNNEYARIKNGENKQSRKDRITRLEYEDLPEHYQNMHEKNDWISGRFTENFIISSGEPKYIEELKRLKSPKSIQNNFGNQLERTRERYNSSRQTLVYRRRDYVNKYPPCSFKPDNMLNDDFDDEMHMLSQIELPKYKEKIKAARESALEQFQNEFLAKLYSNIDAVQTQVRDLNKVLRNSLLAADKYKLIVERNPDYSDYYNMIMDPDNMENKEGLFAMSFQSRYGVLIDGLFSQIVASDDIALNARKQSELLQNIEKFTDYRTYLHFDIEVTDINDYSEYLSKTLKEKSGGETQTPFYIAILASFAQVYKIQDRSSFGNTMRLVVFDEAFNKMDSERIVECVRLLRQLGLQAIFSTPPDKLTDIMPEADSTFLTYKEKYRMQIMPWSKTMEDKVLEL